MGQIWSEELYHLTCGAAHKGGTVAAGALEGAAINSTTTKF